ncbi:MAG: 50S ribosomal protein L9 [Chitinophagales bacterium]|nr:50S ribosomal protein L9 [Chitinophagales bacterium]
MEVILLKDVEHLGLENDLVKVKAGYGRNYLLPKGLAVVANESSKRTFEEQRKQAARREEKMMSALQEVVNTLKSSVVKVGAKAGTSEKIFGSVTTLQLAEALKKQKNITIDRKKITLPEDIKVLGSYTAVVELHKDVKVDLAFEVVAE